MMWTGQTVDPMSEENIQKRTDIICCGLKELRHLQKDHKWHRDSIHWLLRHPYACAFCLINCHELCNSRTISTDKKCQCASPLHPILHP